MDSVILLEKVRRPDPRGLVRDRLEQRLGALDAPPIGLVLGPPGSGKTTVLSRVAASGAGPTAWYRASRPSRPAPSMRCLPRWRRTAGRSGSWWTTST